MGGRYKIEEGVLAAARLRQWDRGWAFFRWFFDCYGWARWDCEEVDFQRTTFRLVM